MSKTEAMGECTKETAFSILDYFHANGGNHIDTANMYMEGQSEQWLREWMETCGIRDEMVVATKYALPLPGNGGNDRILANFGGTNKKSLRLSLEQSLKNLSTDYVDIMYVHGWEAFANISEIMRGLDDMIRAGKVLYLGVSNWPGWAVVKANEFARHNSLTPFIVYEGRWNPAEREIEREIVPMCKAEGMGINVWSALGSGKLKGRVAGGGGGAPGVDDHLGGAPLENF